MEMLHHTDNTKGHLLKCQIFSNNRFKNDAHNTIYLISIFFKYFKIMPPFNTLLLALTLPTAVMEKLKRLLIKI